MECFVTPPWQSTFPRLIATFEGASFLNCAYFIVIHDEE